MTRPLLPLLIAAVTTLGCGQQNYSNMSISSEYAESEVGYDAYDIGSERLVDSSASLADAAQQVKSMVTAQNPPAEQPPDAAVLNRKIIYRSTIGLVVDDYKAFETNLPALVGKHGGFVANSETDRRYRDQQTGTWVVRVPVGSYNDFLSGVTALGFAESRSENAEDVTEEYVDLEARIKNKRTLETRILAMLEERSGKLSDVLEIERELSRVREEIERMEGRVRFLKDRTSLATVTINCREEREYEPTEAPTLGSRIQQSWGGSLGSLQITAEHILLAAIALLPWLVVFGIPLIILWKTVLRGRLRRTEPQAKA